MNSKGFTLFEMVLVIVILGVLAVFAVPKFMGLQSDARIATLKATQGVIDSAFAAVAVKSQLPSADIQPCDYHKQMRCLVLNGQQIRLTNEDNYPWFVFFPDEAFAQFNQLVDADIAQLNEDYHGVEALTLKQTTTADFGFFHHLKAIGTSSRSFVAAFTTPQQQQLKQAKVQQP
ncbi:MSHA pilin protein MshA [Vibrio ponticus]|nr:MSHA pilin protein MshA [Vibrio ponticus]